MGADLSVPTLKGRLTDQVLGLMERLGTSMKIETAQEVVKTVSEFSPWFLIAGGFNITDWEQVKADLHIAQKERGPRAFPLAVFLLWRLIRDALLSNDIIIKEQLEVLNKTPEEIQKVKSESSIRSFEEQEVRSIEDLKEKEKILKGKITLLNKQLKKE